MVSEARIDQHKGLTPESCLSWLRSQEGCPKHDLFPLEYIRCARIIVFINVKFMLYDLTPSPSHDLSTDNDLSWYRIMTSIF